eukprot:CAMPEP_0174275330 /NCGR_PEP_ID=MMETSP0439-20130205/59763_1 /TAXON_ID=0 /ORGANISM="Stereomyxa ramosa, Strain Chinc5" /LENGTH=486 /DNA_ID=CAMNT_0015367421 /DNA_START=8 /DNA_END=1468 /DNA_ORIENTATION=+
MQQYQPPLPPTAQQQQINNNSGGLPPNAAIEHVKLFCGQIPKMMNEQALMPMFTEFGEVIDLTIIRDRNDGSHRGCCFVTYPSRAEADLCIAAYHNQKILPPMQKPMQVKYADGEAERLEHKIFVGMIPYTWTEEKVREIFQAYGPMNECVLLKERDGTSKGYGFVKYETKTSALKAINELHGMRLEELGPGKSLIVRFADKKKKKDDDISNVSPELLEQIKQQQLQLLLEQLGAGGLWGALGATAQGLGAMGAMGGMGALGGMGGMGAMGAMGGASMNPMATDLSALGMGTTGTGTGITPGAGLGLGSAGAATTAQNQLAQLYQQAGYGAQTGGYGAGATGYGAQAGYGQAGYGAQAASAYGASQISGALSQLASTLSNSNYGYGQPSSSGSSSQTKGPAGANIFVYHLPTHFGDQELAIAFAPFGNILSTKVFVDRNSGESKGFGFVSYDSPAAAQMAIQSMHGYQIGNKRLQVQLKKPAGAQY